MISKNLIIILLTIRYSYGFYWSEWKPEEPFPSNAIYVGRDIDENRVYIGRAEHANEVIPANIIPAKRACYLAHDGKEVNINMHRCKVLRQSTLIWVPSSDGHLPSGALVGGYTENGNKFYVGRILHEGSHVVGKILRDRKVISVPFNGIELLRTKYDVLVNSNA